MIEIIPNLPPHVVGIMASGQVTAEDYEFVIIPAVEAALRDHDKVRILYHIDPGLTGFTPGALWDDTKLGLGHLTAWERIAIVTDKEWIIGAVNIFRFALPCPVKVFAVNEAAQAQAWIVAEE